MLVCINEYLFSFCIFEVKREYLHLMQNEAPLPIKGGEDDSFKVLHFLGILGSDGVRFRRRKSSSFQCSSFKDFALRYTVVYFHLLFLSSSSTPMSLLSSSPPPSLLGVDGFVKRFG